MDIVQGLQVEEKTIGIQDGVFVDKCVALEIYKQEEDQIVYQVDWYCYAGDMRLTKVFVPEFNEATMKGIH